MRVTRKQKEITRKRIVETAAAQFCRHGAGNVSLIAVMKEIGLTVGGYYNHFPSREALVLEALSLAADQQIARWQQARRALPHRDGMFPKLIQDYLSREHRDEPGSGCPLPALATDVSRMDAKAQHVFSGKLAEMIVALSAELKIRDRDAIGLMASLVGAVVLARACAATALSDDILRSVRDGILQAWAGKARSGRHDAPALPRIRRRKRRVDDGSRTSAPRT